MCTLPHKHKTMTLCTHDTATPALDFVQVYQSELEVIDGALPADLSGAFLRNGPNPKLPVEGGYHW